VCGYSWSDADICGDKYFEYDDLEFCSKSCVKTHKQQQIAEYVIKIKKTVEKISTLREQQSDCDSSDSEEYITNDHRSEEIGNKLNYIQALADSIQEVIKTKPTEHMIL